MLSKVPNALGISGDDAEPLHEHLRRCQLGERRVAIEKNVSDLGHPLPVLRVIYVLRCLVARQQAARASAHECGPSPFEQQFLVVEIPSVTVSMVAFPAVLSSSLTACGLSCVPAQERRHSGTLVADGYVCWHPCQSVHVKPSHQVSGFLPECH